MESIIAETVWISNISKTCRICLQEKNNTALENLFVDNGPHEVVRKIFECTQILLEDKKQLPHLICKNCIKEVDIAIGFRLKCTSAEYKLRKYCEMLEKELVVNSDHNKTYDLENFEIKIIEMKFHCEICKKTFKNSKSLLSHKLAIHNKLHPKMKINHVYNCEKCSFSTNRRQSLQYHLRTHTGEKPYICDCGKTFAQPGTLAMHRKTHSQNTFFTCSKCGKQFKYKISFQKHQYVHEPAKFSCDLCKKNLKSKQSLKAHMKRHYNVRNFNCENCGATFVTASELSNHKRKYEIEKKFQCNFCSYRTYMKKLLISHIQRHMGEKGFTCTLCIYSCHTVHELRRHERIHIGQKPFSCPVCNQRFMHSPSVNKHMLNIHRTQFKWNDRVDRSVVKVTTKPN